MKDKYKYLAGIALIGVSLSILWFVPKAEAADVCSTFTYANTGANIGLRMYKGENNKIGNITSGAGSAIADMGKSSGKWYWEVRIDTGYPETGVNGWNTGVFGITKGTTATSSYAGSDTNSYGYGQSSGAITYNASSRAYGPSLVAGDVLGFALNMDDDQLTIFLNGVDLGIAANDLTGTWYPMGGASGFSTAATYNFGQWDFAYEPPEGFEWGLYDTGHCNASVGVITKEDMIIENPILNLFLGMLLFYITAFFVMWIFKKN